MSKSYERKKQYKRALHKFCKEGMINDVDGKMIKRSGAKDNSMKRDFYPQN